MIQWCSELTDLLQSRLEKECGERILVQMAMAHGKPTIREAMRSLHKANASRLLVLPLFPQYAAVSVGSVFDLVARELSGWRWIPDLRFITGYFEDRGYQDAMISSVRQHWENTGQGEHLVVSFHSMPRKYTQAGDPYYCFCHKTARKLASGLGLTDDQWTLCFQSKFGPGDWLTPSTRNTLEELADRGVRQVDLICPGFSVDCLETLLEVRMELAGQFAEKGGVLRYVSCLNASPAHVDLLAGVVVRELGGWEESLLPARAVPVLDERAQA